MPKLSSRRENADSSSVLETSSTQLPAEFIDEKSLLKLLPISRRTLFNWRTSGKIPSVRLGGRRVLFHWPSIQAALLRKQVGGVA